MTSKDVSDAQLAVDEKILDIFSEIISCFACSGKWKLGSLYIHESTRGT